MTYLPPVVIGDSQRCAQCDRLLGRAGRSDEELLAAIRDGSFLTSFGVVDYSTEPPTVTHYCGVHRAQSRAPSDAPTTDRERGESNA